MDDLIPKVPVVRLGVDPGAPEGDRSVFAVLQGAKLLYVLQPGESWETAGTDGVIVAHAERPPKWVHFEQGAVLESPIVL